MRKYIDMHCHILCEIDDGAKNIEETKKMLMKAYNEGIRYIIATPHYHPKRGMASVNEIKEKIRLVREEAKKIDDKFCVFPGNEIYFGQDIAELLLQKKILTMNGSQYVLVEFSDYCDEAYIKLGIQQLQAKGFKVILAHVERYQCMRENMEFTRYLYDIGVHLQINSGSVLGQSGRTVKKYVKELLKEELVFCVGTDAHDHKKRAPHMHKAARYVEKKYGKNYARRIFFSNAAQLLKRQE